MIDPRAVTELDEEIGARLRARRHELNLPMAHVAEAVGIAFQQLQKYELGQNRVSAAMLTRLADVLHVDVIELLPGKPRGRGKASAEDGMALQLQQVFSNIRAKRERQLVLDLARRFAAKDTPNAKKKARR